MSLQRPPGLRLHPRTMPVRRAGADLKVWLWGFQQSHDLTHAEMLILVSEHVESLAKLILREERHPGEPDRKADEA